MVRFLDSQLFYFLKRTCNVSQPKPLTASGSQLQLCPRILTSSVSGIAMMQRRGLTAWFVLVEDQRSRHGYSQDQRSVLVLPSFSCNPLFGPGCVVCQVQFRMKLLHDPTLFGNQPHPAPLHWSVYHSVYRSVIGTRGYRCMTTMVRCRTRTE